MKKAWEMTKKEIFQNEIEFKKSRPDLFETVKLGNASKRNLEDIHRNVIKQALSEGKPVPVEVLADYPEIYGSLRGCKV